MKKCPYCGAKYPDEDAICPVDHEILVMDGLQKAEPRKVVRAGSTLSSLIVFLSVLVIALYFCVFDAFYAVSALLSGWTYSFGIIFNNTTKVYRDVSPKQYWVVVVFLIITCVVGISVSAKAATEVIGQFRKSRSKKD